MKKRSLLYSILASSVIFTAVAVPAELHLNNINKKNHSIPQKTIPFETKITPIAPYKIKPPLTEQSQENIPLLNEQKKISPTQPIPYLPTTEQNPILASQFFHDDEIKKYNSVNNSSPSNFNARNFTGRRLDGLEQLIKIAHQLALCNDDFVINGNYAFAELFNYKPTEPQLITTISQDGGFGMTCNKEFLIVAKAGEYLTDLGKYEVEVKRIKQDGNALEYEQPWISLDRALKNYNGGKTIIRGGEERPHKKSEHYRGNRE